MIKIDIKTKFKIENIFKIIENFVQSFLSTIHFQERHKTERQIHCMGSSQTVLSPSPHNSHFD